MDIPRRAFLGGAAAALCGETGCGNDVLSTALLQAGVAAAGEVDRPEAGEYQQTAAAVVLQKLCVRAEIQVGQVAGIFVNETDFLVGQHIHPQLHAILVFHAIL